MGPVTVVILFPGCDLGAGVGQGREQHLVQKLVPKAAVEAFDVEQANATGSRERVSDLLCIGDLVHAS